MEYCPRNQTLSFDYSQLSSLSPCLTDTLTSSVVADLAVRVSVRQGDRLLSTLTSSVVADLAVLGSVIQLSVYAKYTTQTDRYTSLKSKLFKLHILLHMLLVCFPLVKLFALTYTVQDGNFYVYQLISAIFTG